MPLRKLREKINIFLYDSKDRMLLSLKILNLLVSILAIGTLIYYYGFPLTPQIEATLLEIIKASFIFYVMSFIIRLIYDFNPLQFLKNTWYEGVIMLLLVIEGIAFNFFGTLLLPELFIRLGFESFADFSTIFIQLYFLIIVLIELSRSTNLIPKVRLHPASIFMLSFLLIILGGTGLLMLPEMTMIEGSMNFLDALFTSTSATCVTGLIVEDTATFFTFKGQMVIMTLIKLGGLNIIAFGTFILLMAKFGVGVKHDSIVEDFVNKQSVVSAKGMFGKVIVWSLTIEVIGAILMFFAWGNDMPHTAGFGDRVFHSFFHSFSAFNNAGMSTFTDGLYNEGIRDNYFIHMLVTALVFIGALGFAAIFDLFDPKQLRERMRRPWKTISFSTKIALYFSIGLVVFGMAAFFLLENNNTLEGQTWGEKMVTSLFQSVTRTSGFNTVDIGSMTIPMLLIMLFLMFIGSSSSSTGGGIKTSTFAILSAATLSTIKGKRHVELFNRMIPVDLILKAFSVLAFFIVGILIAVILLSITEYEILAQSNRNILDLIFEEVSAFGTVGLSTGITADLSPAGKVIIVTSMFVGRVGTLTVAYLFGKKVISTKYKYPEGHTMVG